MRYKNVTPAKSYVEKKLKNKVIKVLFDEENLKSEIARMVRAAREEEGLSQRELASKAGTTQGVIARLELGTDTRVPSLLLVAKLLKAAGRNLEIRCVTD